MQFALITLLAGTAALAQAVPQGYETAPAAPQTVGFGTCAPNTKISCCTQKAGNTGILGNVLGGACEMPDVTGGVCRGGDTFCCPTKQSGELDISLSCTPLALKLR